MLRLLSEDSFRGGGYGSRTQLVLRLGTPPPLSRNLAIPSRLLVWHCRSAFPRSISKSTLRRVRDVPFLYQGRIEPSGIVAQVLGRPYPFSGERDAITHWIEEPEETSIWFFVENKADRYPVIYRIIHYQFGAEGDFGLDLNGQNAFLLELDHLIRDIESVRLSDEAKRFSGKRVSPEAALYGLMRLKEFVEEVKRRGWEFRNSPD